mmetsp:Transcript_95601/g.256993  ORF Transcript_95601/g.256993 Transcript_95601/m.256993 type:complete len:87 (-) Transcript_95601:45-305(-)
MLFGFSLLARLLFRPWAAPVLVCPPRVELLSMLLLVAVEVWVLGLLGLTTTTTNHQQSGVTVWMLRVKRLVLFGMCRSTRLLAICR